MKKFAQLPFSSRLVRGVGYGLLAITIWGLWLALTRRGVSTNLTASDLTALRFFVSGLILLPVVLKRGISVGRFGWKGALLLTSCAGAPYMLMVASALRYSGAANAILEYGMEPIFIAMLAWMVFKEPISTQRLLGFVVSIVGLVVLTTGGGTSIGFSYHHLCFLLGAFAWAIFTTATKAWKVEPLHATAIVAVLSLAGYLPYYVLSGQISHLALVPWEDILLQAIVQGVLTAIIALWAYGKAIAYLDPSRAGFFPILTPVMGAVISIPLLNEVPSLMVILGMTIVCFGFLLGLNLNVSNYWRTYAR